MALYNRKISPFVFKDTQPSNGASPFEIKYRSLFSKVLFLRNWNPCRSNVSRLTEVYSSSFSASAPTTTLPFPILISGTPSTTENLRINAEKALLSCSRLLYPLTPAGGPPTMTIVAPPSANATIFFNVCSGMYFTCGITRVL